MAVTFFKSLSTTTINQCLSLPASLHRRQSPATTTLVIVAILAQCPYLVVPALDLALSMGRKIGRPTNEQRAAQEQQNAQVATLNRVAGMGQYVADINRAVELMQQAPEEIGGIIAHLQKAVASRAAGGLLEKWHRTYYKVLKIGPQFMESVLKSYITVSAASWATMRVTKQRTGATETSEVELLFYWYFNLLPNMDLPCLYKRVFEILCSERYTQYGSSHCLYLFCVWCFVSEGANQSFEMKSNIVFI